MKVDYRLRLAGRLSVRAEAALRAQFSSLVAWAGEAGLDVQPQIDAVVEDEDALDAAHASAPVADVPQAPVRRGRK